MSFLRSLRTPATPQAGLARPATGGGTIKYDLLLTARLEQEHLTLLNLYSQTQLLFSGADVDGARHSLGELHLKLRDLTQLKGVKLFVPLSRRLQFQPEILVTVLSGQQRLNELSAMVAELRAMLAKAHPDGRFADRIQAGLNQLGALLTSAIEYEESHIHRLYRRLKETN